MGIGWLGVRVGVSAVVVGIVNAYTAIPSCIHRHRHYCDVSDHRGPRRHRHHDSGCVFWSALTAQGGGTYRPFLEHGWSQLESTGKLIPMEISSELTSNSVAAKGMPEGSTVQISVQAMGPTSEDDDDNPIQFARSVLLETLPASSTINEDDDDGISTAGIQVLNFVVFCRKVVWGVDLVSLPGDKHLLALDLQPMTTTTDDDASSPFATSAWNGLLKEWHQQHVVDNEFEWGGDLPKEARKFFSDYTLWTRMKGPQSLPVIQTKVMEAFQAHQELFLQHVIPNVTANDDAGTVNHQEEYLEYRRTNDPARPMLRSLYGPEWTERLIDEILFPKEL